MRPGSVIRLAVALLCAAGPAAGRPVNGSVQELPFVSWPSGDAPARLDNLLQLRLNARWSPWAPASLEAAGRLLCYAGRDFKDGGLAAKQLDVDPGAVDLTWAQGRDQTPLVLCENIDRLSLRLAHGPLEGAIGRQRINWGTNLVWNPNDWFNASNYLDFAYPERPGADALRLQYYPGPTSVVELAGQAGRTRAARTLAALCKFNRWAYDWQFQAGLSGNDPAAGFSWSGSIKRAAFRGELAAYWSMAGNRWTKKTTTVASVSGDYTFPNSLSLQAAALYNGFGAADGQAVSPAATGRVTARALVPTQSALFGEAAYQAHPLLRLDLAAFTGPADGSFCLVPSAVLSVRNNVDLTVLGQFFHGRTGDLYGGAADQLAVGLKWSF